MSRPVVIGGHVVNGFLPPIHARRNAVTMEWMPLDPPAKIHADDLDWLERLWEESDLLDYKLWRAGVS